jgi:hypothetical protein
MRVEQRPVDETAHGLSVVASGSDGSPTAVTRNEPSASALTTRADRPVALSDVPVA